MKKNQAKWKYVLKTALLFSFIQANLIQFIKLLFGDATIEFETKLQIFAGWILGTATLTIFLLPIGLLFGLYLWRKSKRGQFTAL